MKLERELMRGIGPTAVLKLLEPGEKYGYELVTALDRQSDGVLAVGQSTLYPMLYNLEAKGFIKARLDATGPRPRKYYRLTGKGKTQLRRSAGQCEALVSALARLDLAPTPPQPAGGVA